MRHTSHEHLTDTEISAIRDFNTLNRNHMTVGYTPRQRVFTLLDSDGRLLASSPELWDALDSGMALERSRIERIAA